MAKFDKRKPAYRDYCKRCNKRTTFPFLGNDEEKKREKLRLCVLCYKKYKRGVK